MISLQFWIYDYLHLNKPHLIINDFIDINITLRELIQKNKFQLSNDNLVIIKILKIYKNNPKKFIDNNNPYWNTNLTIVDYINYYNIKSNKCDFIITINRN